MSIPAPFVSAPMAIEKAWIDYNGHLNMAYYHVLFDRCSDEAFETMGLGPAYAAERRMTVYSAEAHVCYVRELHLDHPVVVSFRLLDHDAKRLRCYQEIRHIDGWLAATSETLSLHIDMSGPKVAPFPPDILARVEEVAEAHRALPLPERAGRAIGIPENLRRIDAPRIFAVRNQNDRKPLRPALRGVSGSIMAHDRDRRDDWHLTDDLHAETGMGDPFAAAIRATRMAMIITDPRRPDNPIVFANDSFLRLTGYGAAEVMGRNCRFLQGPDTDRASVDAIREAIEGRRSVSIDVLNYRKDGTSFWNALYISPVSNEAGELQFFFASQLDVSDRKSMELRVAAEKERFEQAVRDRTAELEIALAAKTALLHEVDHRVKNNLQMVSSLIIMQSRLIPDDGVRASLKAMLERVEALSTVHRRLYQSDDIQRFDVADFVRDLVSDLVGASGRDISVKLDLQPVFVPAERASSIALIINELVTNAIKHAFPAGREGTIAVTVRPAGDRFVVEVADDGAGMGNAGEASSFGLKLIRSLARQLQAEIAIERSEPGTRVILTLPIEPTVRQE